MKILITVLLVRIRFGISICIIFALSNFMPFSCAYSVNTSHVYCVSSASVLLVTNTSNEHDTKLLELVPAADGDLIELKCATCGSTNQTKLSKPRTWYHTDIREEAPWKEMRFDLRSHVTKQHRVFSKFDNTLIISSFQAKTDSGRYECQGHAGDNEDHIAYLLDAMQAYPPDVDPYKTGDKTFAIQYESMAEQVGDELSRLSHDQSVDVIYSWSKWGPCESCHGGSGFRWRRGRCKIIAPANIGFLPYNLTSLSCRSTLLPILNLTKKIDLELLSIPDFLMFEPCEPCFFHENVTHIDDTYLRRVTIEAHERQNLIVPCPLVDAIDMVEWKKGFDLVLVGIWSKLGDKSRMLVDTLGHLHIENVDRHVSGRYSCHAGKRTWRFLIHVREDFIPLTEEFYRHLFYLCGVLFLCFVVYVVYLLMLCFESSDARLRIIYGADSLVFDGDDHDEGSVMHSRLPWTSSTESLQNNPDDDDDDKEEEISQDSLPTGDDGEVWLPLTPQKYKTSRGETQNHHHQQTPNRGENETLLRSRRFSSLTTIPKRLDFDAETPPPVTSSVQELLISMNLPQPRCIRLAPVSRPRECCVISEMRRPTCCNTIRQPSDGDKSDEDSAQFYDTQSYHQCRGPYSRPSEH